jgi:hypothetical protein
MSEGYFSDGKYVPWTAAHILDAADAEVGPGCCDESYQKLRGVMEAAPDLLEALEYLMRIADRSGDERYVQIQLTPEFFEPTRAAIARAIGEA